MEVNEQEYYDGKVESIDWRYSASIVGLVQYMNYLAAVEYEGLCDYKMDYDTLYYHKEVVNEKWYLKFVEYKYQADMHHKVVEQALQQEEYSVDAIDFINKKLVANTIMKKYFSKLKFNGKNKEEILHTIEVYRQELIKETYRNKANLYKNFLNPEQLFNNKQQYSRLTGYYIDGPKKGKTIAYNFYSANFCCEDSELFDFIPFAFTIGRDALFINNNSELNALIASNQELNMKVEAASKDATKSMPNVRRAFFKAMIETKDFIDFDVEVVTKGREDSFYELMYLRKQSIQVLRGLKDYQCFCFSYKVNDNYYINIQEEVTDAIVNMTNVDKLIKMFLKLDCKSEDSKNQKHTYIIDQLIEVNVLIYGGEGMEERIKAAKYSARKVMQSTKMEKNKVESYRSRLVSALTFKDYDRYLQVLMQLANYTNLELDFAYHLFNNFDENKDIAYAFVNALVKKDENQEGK